MAFATAHLVRRVFDDFLRPVSQATSSSLWPWAVALVFVALVTAWLRMRETVDAERLGQDYVLEVRRLLMMHLTHLSTRAQGQRASGTVFLRFVGDLTALRQWLSQGLAKLSVAGVMVPGILLVLLSMSPVLAGVVALILALATMLAGRLGASLEAAVRESRQRRSRLAANISEKISQMAVVQVHGSGRRERNRMYGQSEKLVQAMIDRARAVGTMRGLAQLTATLASVGALLSGVFEVRAGNMSPGAVVAAMSVVGLMVGPIRDLGRVSEFWHASRVAGEKLQATLARGPLIYNHPDAQPLASGPGRVEFRQTGITGVLSDLNLVAIAGQRVLLRGENGSGKSALLALVPRLIDPDQGQILVDGQDVSRVSLGSLRRAIGMVSPDLPLLRGSLRHNLTYRNPEVDEARLQATIALCGVDRLLRELPQGLDTRLSESAANLSPGQRRRVMLARALLGGPRILLLDEADANVDDETLAIFKRVLEQFSGTVLFVSRRPDLERYADAVWSFSGGHVSTQVVAAGTAAGSARQRELQP